MKLDHLSCFAFLGFFECFFFFFLFTSLVLLSLLPRLDSFDESMPGNGILGGGSQALTSSSEPSFDDSLAPFDFLTDLLSRGVFDLECLLCRLLFLDDSSSLGVLGGPDDGMLAGGLAGGLKFFFGGAPGGGPGGAFLADGGGAPIGGGGFALILPPRPADDGLAIGKLFGFSLSESSPDLVPSSSSSSSFAVLSPLADSLELSSDLSSLSSPSSSLFSAEDLSSAADSSPSPSGPSRGVSRLFSDSPSPLALLSALTLRKAAVGNTIGILAGPSGFSVSALAKAAFAASGSPMPGSMEAGFFIARRGPRVGGLLFPRAILGRPRVAWLRSGPVVSGASFNTLSLLKPGPEARGDLPGLALFLRSPGCFLGAFCRFGLSFSRLSLSFFSFCRFSSSFALAFLASSSFAFSISWFLSSSSSSAPSDSAIPSSFPETISNI
mmetsp:Transcript_11811/g.12993  ORF Transcript_11811/g.12993 Transcript_11811/m.12993 type:complete len:439 (-) Transcript_11811:423-1739(-)